MIVNEEDMPFNPMTGMTPDLVVNPHAIPSRMTIGQLMECLLGKTCAIRGEFGDGTAFSRLSIDTISDILEKEGWNRGGYEQLYDGYTGRPMRAMVFMGPTLYQRLKHMVSDKIHSRARGPVTIRERQPMEGRARDGGLRFGEMERDANIGHGAAAMLQDRLCNNSDKTIVDICDRCGMLAMPAHSKRFGESVRGATASCKACGTGARCRRVVMPYSMKLLHNELTAMHITPRLRLERISSL